MTYHSARRMLSACIAAVALVAALAMATAGTASATSDLTSQCSGANIKGQGSTFQAPAQEPVWNVDFNASTDTNVLGCAGNTGQGDLKKPTVTYESTGSHSGSGACLKGFGDGEAPKYEEYPYCGTDEAPSASAEALMEANKASSDKETKTIESIPVLQGSVAVLIHLPAGCVASDEAKVGGKMVKQGRLALDDATVAKIYEGEIRNWKEVEDSSDRRPRRDHVHRRRHRRGNPDQRGRPRSTNQARRTSSSRFWRRSAPSHKFETEEFNEISEEGVLKKNPCGVVLPPEMKTWENVQEGCENQRWPLAAKVVRPFLKGNPGVVGEVNAKAQQHRLRRSRGGPQRRLLLEEMRGARESARMRWGKQKRLGNQTRRTEPQVLGPDPEQRSSRRRIRRPREQPGSSKKSTQLQLRRHQVHRENRRSDPADKHA